MSIRASAVSRSITPGNMLKLAGYAGTSRVSTGVRDDLLVSAVHMRGGSGGIIVLSLDLLYLDAAYVRRLRREIFKATGTLEKNIFVGTSQTHSAPAMSRALYRYIDPSYSKPDADYVEFVVAQSVQAASEAVVTSRPAAVARLVFGEPGAGAVVVKDSLNGRAVAVIAVNDRVPDSLGPENTEISSDFVGVARQELAKRFGGNPALAYFCAPSEDDRSPAEAVTGVDEMDKAGIAFADLIVSKVQDLPGSDFMPNISFSGGLFDVDPLPRRQLPEAEEAAIMLMEANDEVSRLDSAGADEKERAAAVAKVARVNETMNLIVARKSGELDDALDDVEPAQVHAVKIGSARLLGMPGRISRRACRMLTDKIGGNVLIVETVNGDLQGSFLTVDEANPDGYSMVGSVYESQAGRLLAETALGAL